MSKICQNWLINVSDGPDTRTPHLILGRAWNELWFGFNLFLNFPAFIACPFGIGTLASRKKRQKLFWKCIFALLHLKRKINIEGQFVYCFFYIGDSRCHTAWEQLNANNALSSLYAWHVFDIWRTFRQKTI